MVIQEVKDLVKSIFEREDCKIDLSINYNENKTATLVVLYPNLYVENTEDYDISIEITNFVFKIVMSIQEVNGEIHLKRFIDKRAYNLNPTAEMIVAGYVHSHVNNYSIHEICLGNGQANTQWLKLSDYNFMETSDDELISDVLFDFLINLNKVFHIEDQDGGPWVKIEEVRNNDDNFVAIEDIPIDDFQEVAEYHSLTNDWLEDYIDEHSYVLYNFCPETVMYLLESFEVSRDILTDKRNNIINYIYSDFINPLIKCYPFRRSLNEYDSDISLYQDSLYHGLQTDSERHYSRFLFFCNYLCDTWQSNKDGSEYTYVHLIDDLETIDDEYDKVEVNAVLSTDFCYFSTRTSDDEIFKYEELEELFRHKITNNKTDNSIDDILSSLTNTSFYIDEKFYYGELPDLSDLETEVFYINDHSKTIYLYEHQNKITKTVIDCIKLQSKANSTIDEIRRYTSSFNWGASA